MSHDTPLRVGLLLCDHLGPDIAEGIGDYTDLFPAAFEPHGIELVVHEVTRDSFPSSALDHDGWMISGSRHSTYDDLDWIGPLEGLIREIVATRRPLAGICFGHQLIAQALGGAVAPAEAGWGVGVREFEVVDPAPWMDPVERFRILMSHRDQVTRLPDEAQVIATTGYCPVGGYRIEDHVFCVQGHPEWVPTLSRRLMAQRRDAIGAETVDHALVTLDGPKDQALVAGWIARFLRQTR